jgi:hypothetical protein
MVTNTKFRPLFVDETARNEEYRNTIDGHFQRGTMAELFAIPAVVITDTLRRLVIFYEDTKITCSNDCRATLRVGVRRGRKREAR